MHKMFTPFYDANKKAMLPNFMQHNNTNKEKVSLSQVQNRYKLNIVVNSQLLLLLLVGYGIGMDGEERTKIIMCCEQNTYGIPKEILFIAEINFNENYPKNISYKKIKFNTQFSEITISFLYFSFLINILVAIVKQ